MKRDQLAAPAADWTEQAHRSRRAQRRVEAESHERRTCLARWGSLAILAVVVLAIGWLVSRQFGTTPTASGEFPAPRGGANQAQDVNTLVGSQAPAFTLSDAEGRSYTVTPGRGRPLVLVSHMGIT